MRDVWPGQEPQVRSCAAAVDVPVRGRGSTAVMHEDRHGVVGHEILGASSPEHRDVLGDGQHEGADRVVLGAARQPAVALPQRKTYRPETIDREDHQHPDGRVAAVRQ